MSVHNVWFRKYPYLSAPPPLPQWKVIGNSKGEAEVCEARLVLGKYGDKPEFPKRWGL